ncbi:MAG: hypothetical protein ACLFMN_07890 [Desulfobacterales bacterium]
MTHKDSSSQYQGIRNLNGTQSIHRAVAVLRVVSKYNQAGVNLSRITRETNKCLTRAGGRDH